MVFFALHTGTPRVRTSPEEHRLVTLHEPLHNTSDGSEFIDDALRMKDQPFQTPTEESIAAGSPRNLL